MVTDGAISALVMLPIMLPAESVRKTVQAVILAVSGLDLVLLFLFQAEDGIRDPLVTGVQTCALPILPDLREGGRGEMMSRSTSSGTLARIARGGLLQPLARLGVERVGAPHPLTIAAQPEQAIGPWRRRACRYV